MPDISRHSILETRGQDNTYEEATPEEYFDAEDYRSETPDCTTKPLDTNDHITPFLRALLQEDWSNVYGVAQYAEDVPQALQRANEFEEGDLLQELEAFVKDWTSKGVLQPIEGLDFHNADAYKRLA
ncbi:uncharacterized protein B0I36DRAFT_356314 [Microdochium trichocladiopsis]|uniref:Uncharacterized protein n=1 Tax=Microdochium trichocladiopsis TaxID=1682393 RepID=A0A9P8XQQ3_9PEZI|nr:uncharacterized protein B0I36DRAFT_356314 [Microdochium trichocladiopsis]KAH7012235.1 hypothetical protein B0I36DRAFT_356314 [Microdochium trichocladiopsis]